MSQEMRSTQGYAPLRVQRAFKQMDDGRGNTAKALSEALGVALQVAPEIAQYESDDAFKAGMQARVSGVQRENAAASNKSLLGFMFSRQANDGFDYQDAQMDLPVLQSQELLEAEKRLRESRNPGDLQAYLDERDAVVADMFGERSDMYRYTVAEGLMKTRGDIARSFTSWVQRNREADRRAAAAAAAQAAAQAKAMRLRSAGDAVYDALTSGDEDFDPGEFIKTAPDKYGIKPGEAKGVLLDAFIFEADRSNDTRLLEQFDARYLDFEHRQKLADAEDKIWAEQRRRESAAAEAAAADARREEDLAEMEGEARLTGLMIANAKGEVTVAGATSELLTNPYFAANPDKLSTAITTMTKVDSTYTDPALDAANLSSFQQEALRAATTGDRIALEVATQEALREVRSPAKRERIVEIYENAEKYARDDLFEDPLFQSYIKDLTQTYPSGTGSGEQSLAGRFAGETADNYFAAQVDTLGQDIMQDTIFQMAGDFYRLNPEADRIPIQERHDIYRRAYAVTKEAIDMTYGQQEKPTTTGSTGDSLEYLKGIAGD